VIDLGAVIEQVTSDVPELALVAGVASLDTINNALTTVPAAFLMPGQERPQAAPGPAAVQAFIVERLTVVLVVQNYADARGAAALAELKALSKAVYDALVDWAPEADCKPLQFAGADPVGFTNQRLVWAMHFETRRVLLDTGVSYELG
jgi:hypothetical protein